MINAHPPHNLPTLRSFPIPYVSAMISSTTPDKLAEIIRDTWPGLHNQESSKFIQKKDSTMENKITTRLYPSGVMDDLTLVSTICDISFTITKKIDCKYKRVKDALVNKLEKLQTENFNRVKIPKFYYEVNNNIVTYTTEFIRGMWAISKEQRQIIYEDVVLKDSDWTFYDYNFTNFIVDDLTKSIYAVDFQSYRYIPNMDFRITDWNTTENHQRKLAEELLK